MLVLYDEEKNRRQVPKTKEYLSSKQYCDMLYCYMQVKSDFDEQKKERYILKKDWKHAAVARDLSLSRQTVSNKLKQMIELKLIEELDDRYIIITLPKEIAELLPFETMRILTNTVKENVISVFIYLLIRYRAEKKEFPFTLRQVKVFIGLGESRSNDYIITDILLVLERLGLLQYELRTERQVDGSFRSTYYVTGMTNKILLTGGNETIEEKC